MVDHTFGTLYDSNDIERLSIYSVSLFIIVAGYLNYLSNKRHDYSYVKYVIHSCKKIIVAYIIATFVYSVVYTHSINIYVFKDFLLHFSATGPFYYVSIYIQLMLVGGVIYRIFELIPGKNILLYEAIMMIFIIILGITVTYSGHIPWIDGRAGILCGGTYLILFFAGMLFSRHGLFSENDDTIKLLTCTLASGVTFVIWWRLMCSDGVNVLYDVFPFGVEQGIATIVSVVQSFIVLCFSWGFFQLCSRHKVTNYITVLIGWIGKHSLFIFLYHMLWLEFVLKRYAVMDKGVVKTVLYFGVMIMMSVLVEILYNQIYKRIINMIY